MKNIIYLTLILTIIPFTVYSYPLWQRNVINFERSDYEAGFQNWMVTQSDNGWIYFANSGGLLEFDGVNWSLYTLNSNMVRSVKVIGKTVYVGGSTEFGYFEPDDTGRLIYYSLSEKTGNWGGEVWNILDAGHCLYFLSEHHIHIYDKDSKGIVTIDTGKKIDCSCIHNDRLYMGTSEGIYYMEENNKLSFLLSSKSLIGEKLVSLLPFQDNLLLTTARSGLYIIRDEATDKISSTADDFIRDNQLFSTSVSGSRIALGSVQNGVFIFDTENPSYMEAYNLTNGLKNNTILSSFFDKDDNLWLGLDKGISYINLNSPVRPLFATVSPIGTGYCSAIYDDILYLGTNQALYKVTRDADYQSVKGAEGQIWSMNIIDNTLFCVGDNGITVVSGRDTYKIDLHGIWEVHPIEADKNKLVAGGYSGLYILSKEKGRWNFSHKIPGFQDSCRGFLEDDEDYTFWIANTNKYIQRIKLNPELSKIINIKNYPLEGATFDSNVTIREIDNNLVACTRDGIYRYSRITDRFEAYTQLESMLEGTKYYEFLTTDNLKNIWFVADKQLKFLPYHNGEYKKHIYNWGLYNQLLDGYENIFFPDSITAIVAVDNAFARVDLSQKDKLSRSVNIFIRKLVNSRNDSILAYGGASKSIKLLYEENSIRIHFAATDYTQMSDILYTYRLKGADDEWSIPSASTSKEYTNLSEGRYVFEVKAIVNGYMEQTGTASISFNVLPPWYRSNLAYIVYLFLVTVSLLIVYKKTISKQKKIISQRGEELIAQRKRYQKETELKDQEIYELQNENLKAELNYKTQELSGYILNIIRKNEMLEDVKKEALSISKAIEDEKQLSVIRQKVMRLIGHINSNIESDIDFKVFQSNFDLVHQDFFKLLDQRFPGLSRNDKILCAYLKMNLSSKEIAPLLNISLRGVEVSRYRLRKKMDLGRDVNLSEFLQTLK